MSSISAILASSLPSASAAPLLGSGAGAPTTRAAGSVVSVRYQVRDVARSIAFYTGQLGFELEQRSAHVFAAVVRGNLRLLLSGPGSSGSRPMPDGEPQGPGGWNRILLYVPDLDACIRELAQRGVAFRNGVETGPGGSQTLIADPDGNVIELHQPPPA